MWHPSFQIAPVGLVVLRSAEGTVRRLCVVGNAGSFCVATDALAMKGEGGGGSLLGGAEHGYHPRTLFQSQPWVSSHVALAWLFSRPLTMAFITMGAPFRFLERYLHFFSLKDVSVALF